MIWVHARAKYLNNTTLDGKFVQVFYSDFDFWKCLDKREEEVVDAFFLSHMDCEWFWRTDNVVEFPSLDYYDRYFDQIVVLSGMNL